MSGTITDQSTTPTINVDFVRLVEPGWRDRFAEAFDERAPSDLTLTVNEDAAVYYLEGRVLYDYDPEFVRAVQEARAATYLRGLLDTHRKAGKLKDSIFKPASFKINQLDGRPSDVPNEPTRVRARLDDQTLSTRPRTYRVVEEKRNLFHANGLDLPQSTSSSNRVPRYRAFLGTVEGPPELCTRRLFLRVLDDLQEDRVPLLGISVLEKSVDS